MNLFSECAVAIRGYCLTVELSKVLFPVDVVTLTTALLLSMDCPLLVLSRLSSRLANVPLWCKMAVVREPKHMPGWDIGDIQDVSPYFLLNFAVNLEVL